jgi:hypothetical protein
VNCRYREPTGAGRRIVEASDRPVPSSLLGRAQACQRRLSRYRPGNGRQHRCDCCAIELAHGSSCCRSGPAVLCCPFGDVEEPRQPNGACKRLSRASGSGSRPRQLIRIFPPADDDVLVPLGVLGCDPVSLDGTLGEAVGGLAFRQSPRSCAGLPAGSSSLVRPFLEAGDAPLELGRRQLANSMPYASLAPKPCVRRTISTAR